MKLKTTDIDPTSPAEAWLVAGLLGYEAVMSGNVVHIIIPRPEWFSGKEYMAFDPTSPDIVLELMEKLHICVMTDHFPQGFSWSAYPYEWDFSFDKLSTGNTIASAVISCAIRTLGDEVEVPDKLVEVEG